MVAYDCEAIIIKAQPPLQHSPGGWDGGAHPLLSWGGSPHGRGCSLQIATGARYYTTAELTPSFICWRQKHVWSFLCLQTLQLHHLLNNQTFLKEVNSFSGCTRTSSFETVAIYYRAQQFTLRHQPHIAHNHLN